MFILLREGKSVIFKEDNKVPGKAPHSDISQGNDFPYWPMWGGPIKASKKKKKKEAIQSKPSLNRESVNLRESKFSVKSKHLEASDINDSGSAIGSKFL